MSKNQNEQKQAEPCVGTSKPITVVAVLQTTSPAAIRNCRYHINLQALRRGLLLSVMNGAGLNVSPENSVLYWPFALLLLLEAMLFMKRTAIFECRDDRTC